MQNLWDGLRKSSQKSRVDTGGFFQMSSTVGAEQILFTRGVPAVEALPARLVSECLQEVLNAPDGWTLLQYGHHGGYQPLRKMLGEQYGVGENEVLVGNGSLHLQDLISALLIKPGDTVLVEQPSYDRAIATFKRRGARVIGVPLELDGVNLEQLEQAARQYKPVFMYTIPDFQNPAGVTVSPEKRRRMVEIATEYGFWLLEDVPYRTLRYTGENISLLREFNPAQVLTISSFSKLISPALRVGYVVGPSDFIARLRQLSEDTILVPVLPTQAAVVSFFKKGYFASNLDFLKELYYPRLQATIASLKKHLPGVPFAEPEGGFFVSVNLPAEANTAGLLARAKEAGLLLTDGTSFFAEPLEQGSDTGARFVRLPFCALTPEQIEEGVRRLASLL
jgi:2-aminoadipate transaminase